MDYKKHYERLITRAKHRNIEGYTEKHHILPRCMDGTNDKGNLVALTAREHFIAHILLVKVYPKEYKLIFAVNAMCCFKENRDCSKNRMYGWLRKRHAAAVGKATTISQQGSKNSQYGTCWISDVEKETSKKINKSELKIYINDGWIKGRNKRKIKCMNCSTVFLPIGHEKRCNKNCKKPHQTRKNFLTGREDELIALYKRYNSLNKALTEMGVSAKGDYFYKAKEVLKI